MPIAAVPTYLATYLEKDFSSASPAQRFGIFLPIWTERKDQEAEVKKRAAKNSREGQEINALLREQGMDATILELQKRQRNPLARLWKKNDFASKYAWEKVTQLSKPDKECMHALATRQTQIAQTLPEQTSLLTLDAITTAPFTTGLGNEHPLENGFAFLNPYGLPYLPGSSIKGVLRQAARELASGEWGDTHGWSTDPIYPLKVGSNTLQLSAIDVLFGLESAIGGNQHVRGALSFWDVIPQIQGNSLQVEIMTPHQSHYYQQKADHQSNADTISPHDSGQPIPINFLTVPPGCAMCFHVLCDLTHLQLLAPNLVMDACWKKLLQTAFEHAFSWVGFGAKTAVGYGAMQIDQKAQKRKEEQEKVRRQQQEQEEKARRHAEDLEKMDPIEREIQQCLDERTDRNLEEIPALITALKTGRWSGEDKRKVALDLKRRMQKEKGKWKESSQAKKPEKDSNYQNTLLVTEWISGQ